MRYSVSDIETSALKLGFMVPDLISFSAVASVVVNVESSQEVTEISLSFKVTPAAGA